MAKRLNITEEQRAEASRRIENFFAFTRDVLSDPAILEQMPDASRIEPVPIAERESGRRYDIETPNTVVTVEPLAPPANLTAKRVHRPGRTAMPGHWQARSTSGQVRRHPVGRSVQPDSGKPTRTAGSKRRREG